MCKVACVRVRWPVHRAFWANSLHLFTTSVLQPLPQPVTPSVSENLSANQQCSTDVQMAMRL